MPVFRRLSLLLLFGAYSHAAYSCDPVDFLAMPLPAGAEDHVLAALTLAYPDMEVSAGGGEVGFGGAQMISLGAPADKTSLEILVDPSVREQFAYAYPLDFDLTARHVAWFDPGRPRNDPFFRALWFSSSAAASASLVPMDLTPLSSSEIHVTTKRGVDCQLRAALDALAPEADRLGRFFAEPGGGYNWRTISGTTRLSPHAFGIAVDLNAALGGYWKWSGAREGDVGDWDPSYPPDLVATMERYGFIWGGKWHHFDGMHFEYRPEIILFSRLERR